MCYFLQKAAGRKNVYLMLTEERGNQTFSLQFLSIHPGCSQAQQTLVPVKALQHGDVTERYSRGSEGMETRAHQSGQWRQEEGSRAEHALYAQGHGDLHVQLTLIQLRERHSPQGRSWLQWCNCTTRQQRWHTDPCTGVWSNGYVTTMSHFIWAHNTQQVSDVNINVCISNSLAATLTMSNYLKSCH